MTNNKKIKLRKSKAGIKQLLYAYVPIRFNYKNKIKCFSINGISHFDAKQIQRTDGEAV